MSTSRRAPGRPLVLGLIAALAASILPGSRVQPALAAPSELFFSEYIEGSSNNKALEIYNGTGVAVNLGTDGYNVQMFFNGNPSPTLTINLVGSIVDSDVFVLAQASANATILAQADQTNGSGWFNGDDAVVLRKGTVVIDAIGQAGFDPGTEWGSGLTSTADNTLRRKASIQAGDTNHTDVFDPSGEWDGFAIDTFGGLGEHAIVEGDVGPLVTATSPANGTSGVGPGSNVEIAFSEPVAVTGAWFSINCTSSGAHSATVSGGPTTFVLDPDADFGAVETCTVTVTASQVSDLDADDPPDNPAADHVFSFTTMDACGSDATQIHAIQASGPTSPMVGQAVEIEGVVVGDFQPSNSFNGFHVQEEDADADADPATSEGIFVFEGGSAVAVAAGDTVRVAGDVVEFSSSGIPLTTLTELSDVSGVVVCGSGASVTPSQVTLPFGDLTFPERLEGMLVETTQDLTVSETFTLGRFGELVLSSGGRLLNPTNVVEPGAPAQALQAANNLNRIVLDDGDNTQNLDPTLYPAGGLSASNTLRIGDTVQPAQFALEQRFGVYRLQPIEAVEFDATNPRPAAPASVGGNLKVAALNVLNYFTTLDDGPDGCGPTGALECRGADTIEELNRQRAKTVAEILGLDADILGLMEIQNDESATVQDLVDALNGATAPGTYASIDTGAIGTDAIKLALLYRPASVTPAGDHAILTSAVDPRFIDTLNRPALAQTFDATSGGRLTVVVNHLKSKGSPCAGDPDTGDGQGNCNGTRTAAAEALVDWIGSDPTGSGDRDVLVIGDLNSYAKEDPIDVFVEAGFTNLIDEFLGAAGYSFVFQGQTGYLDHALASPTLAAQITGTTEWHINADEPTVLDYNVEFKSPGHVTSLYAPTAYRSSDHDPLLVGIDLLHYDFSGFFPPVANPPSVNRFNSGQTIPMRFTLNGDLGLDVLFDDPTAAEFTCGTGDPTGDAATAAGSLIHDPGSSDYKFEWKTLKTWATQCRTFSLTLNDGSYRTADFHFRR